MEIERLIAQGFRNLKPLDISADAPTILLLGDNAQGKTNVLEALYLCATGRSFRQASAPALIAHGSSQAACMAMFRRNDVRHEVRLSWGPQGPTGVLRQRLVVDGRGVAQAARLLGLINVVAFFPEDLRIAKSGPEVRRRFFDRAVAGGRPDFVEASLAYHKALKARNMLLRSPQGSRPMLAAYDQALARHGAAIHLQRTEALAELEPQACASFARLMPASRLGLSWHSGFGDVPEQSGGLEALQAHLLTVLQNGYPRDRARGMTLQGPHRADLRCFVDGQDARVFASQGQQRCLVLALKMAELWALQQRLGTAPILLLDDVSSELDAQRLERLFGWVESLGIQSWVSSTGSVRLPVAGPVQRLRVIAGEVQQMGDSSANQG